MKERRRREEKLKLGFDVIGNVLGIRSSSIESSPRQPDAVQTLLALPVIWKTWFRNPIFVQQVIISLPKIFKKKREKNLT